MSEPVEISPLIFNSISNRGYSMLSAEDNGDFCRREQEIIQSLFL